MVASTGLIGNCSFNALVEQGRIPVDRPAAQYHAANRSEPRPVESPEGHR